MYENIKIYKYRNMKIYMQKNKNMKNIKNYIKKVSIYIYKKNYKVTSNRNAKPNKEYKKGINL